MKENGATKHLRGSIVGFLSGSGELHLYRTAI
jgi:hypothetical protein